MYYKTKDIVEKYNISRSMAGKLIQEMKSLKRYPASAIIGGTCRRIDADAFQDYMENREMLRHPNMQKYVKAYGREMP